jgi:phenylacetate-CoA ligase
MHAYPEIAAADGLTLEALQDLQLSRLRTTLERVYSHTEHYREAFDAAGVKPADLRALADLARFPFTIKADLRARYPFGFYAVGMDEVARIHASSGTTGKPTVVGYTKADLDVWAGLMARSLRGAGVRPGMKVHVAYGYGLFTGGLGAHYGAEALGCAVIPMSGGQTEKQVQLICDFQPEVIMVTPSYMLAILDEFRRQGIDPRKTSLKVGVLGAEPWTEAMRAEIEEAFAIDAIDIYGLSEVMGPGVACEGLESKGGPTIWEDHFLPEIVDPQTGEPLPDGELGELVFTSLTKQAMPIVRYRTRDLTRLTPGVGSPMRRMDKIVGRSDDMLIVRGVNVFPTQVEEQILKLAELAPHFEIVLTRPGRMDEMAVRVEAREAGVGAEAGRRLAAQVKEIVGVTCAVEVCEPGALERSAGKAKRVRDLR